MPTVAALVTNSLAQSGRTRKGPGAIYALALDGDQVVCMSESTLDTWWQSLSPEEKADVWERELEGPADLRAHADAVEQTFIDLLRSPLTITEVKSPVSKNEASGERARIREGIEAACEHFGGFK